MGRSRGRPLGCIGIVTATRSCFNSPGLVMTVGVNGRTVGGLHPEPLLEEATPLLLDLRSES